MSKPKTPMTKDAARRIQSTQTKSTGQQPTKDSFTSRTTRAAHKNTKES